MSSFLARKILISFSSPNPYHCHRHHLHQLPLLTLTLRHCLSISSQSHSQQPTDLPFIAQYLISSFGFSPHRALKHSAMTNLAAIKSSERPESVVTFLKDTGLSHDQIRAAVSFHPRILVCNVEKTLKPKVRELMDAGFSGELLVHLIRYNPAAIYLKDTLSRVLFWRNFVGNNDEVLLKTIQRNPLLFNYDIDNHVLPLINLLKEYELSKGDIVSLLVSNTSRCFKQSPDSLRQTLELIEELGISRGSRMFLLGLKAIGGLSKDKIKKNMEFFMVTYGWSKEEVHAAFRKFPNVLVISENKVKSNMDFLIRNAGFEPRDIALKPVLLGYSAQGVLSPRYTVLSALQAKGFKTKCTLLSACVISERRFHETYVVRHDKDVPGLAEAYAAAGGKGLV